MIPRRVLFALGLAAASTPAAASECAAPLQVDRGTIVAVTGVLQRDIHWGPPNFGENPESDARFDAWILVVSPELDVRLSDPAKGPERQRLSRLQLSVAPEIASRAELLRRVGQSVRASGKLWSASTPGDVLPVVMGVTAMATGTPGDTLTCASR
ncbi:hypothetical protein [Tahibacter amnicola]|uniref:Uncharacterized protein n=1 Tax=Tahibacter amnicola TaxID=2976241 RepID=A0ABY6BFU3_9GAMM|nr:hypothetical protein [Tahibacter amnicola]UXI68898.1 hypothetical protein N4264_04375 [Tahibacter amnicola]